MKIAIIDSGIHPGHPHVGDIAGGVEMLSNVPVALSPPLARALVAASQSRTLGGRAKPIRFQSPLR